VSLLGGIAGEEFKELPKHGEALREESIGRGRSERG
jgi:hypothetical protein